MTERLLQYIWQHGHYNSKELLTTDGLSLQVIHPGFINHNQGPDFLNAHVRIGDTIWVGSIELHVYASEWLGHKHSTDENYSNVILHVVWKEDVLLQLSFPVFELKDRISGLLLNRYEELMQSPLFIACEKHIKNISSLVMNSWMDRLLVERLQERALKMKDLLERNNFHWQEVFWWMLAKNFGLKVNSDTFEKIAESIPVTILARHKTQLVQLEALLFGQAGLLDKKFTDHYPNMLRKEYRFLQKKYSLQKIHYPLHFLRMRPANFPTIRLAQLAALINDSNHLFSIIKDEKDISTIHKLLDVTANDYWHYHYRFDEASAFSKKKLGNQMIENIIINTIIPLLYAYGYYNNREDYKIKAISWMESSGRENNSITQGFEKLGVNNKSAFDSQALIQMKNEYCNYKRCLECSIGNTIFKMNEVL